MSLSIHTHHQHAKPEKTRVDARLPNPRRTCIIADNVASSVVFDAKTSSQRTSDSSTFWVLTRASALSAYFVSVVVVDYQAETLLPL